MRKLFGVVAVALLPVFAGAQVRVLDFEGIGDFNAIGNHYNGGAGANHGVTFFGNALALVQVGYLVTDPCQGSAGFPKAPSGCGALFYYQNQVGGGAGMNMASGFTNGFSLFYYPLTPTTNSASFTVYSGLNGSGTALATLALPQPAFGSPPQPWLPMGVTFSGTAYSVGFMNAGSSLIFDNVTFGSDTPELPEVEAPVQVVPEPASVALFGAGLGVVGFAARRRRKR
jgi:hypothetical protein